MVMTTNQAFRSKEKWLVCGLALVYLLLHLAIIAHSRALVFDEAYYVPEANSIIQERELTTLNHPSLAKLWIVAGIQLLGDNPWGWRIFPVIFGVASVVLLYLVCRRLGGKNIALLASLLLVFENLTFVHSGLAMLDAFYLTFMMLAFLLYLQNRYALSGVSLALSVLCKMAGLFAGLAILAHWLLSERKREARSMGLLVLSGGLAFFLLMPIADFLATGEWLNPFYRAYYMTRETATVKAGSIGEEYLYLLRYPWEWVLNPSSIHYGPRDAHYVSVLTLTTFVSILPSMGFMVYEWLKNRRDLCLFALVWFGATYLIWIPIQLATDRFTMLYYLLPTIPAVCLASGYTMQRLWQIGAEARSTAFKYFLWILLAVYLFLHIHGFFLASPLLR